MDFFDCTSEYHSLIASAADVCFKPWKHSVVQLNINSSEDEIDQTLLDLILRVECRNIEGERISEHDLDLEIYHSGGDLNVMLSWSNNSDRPILWQGPHSVWMNSESGTRCNSPEFGIGLENFARKIRALFLTTN